MNRRDFMNREEILSTVFKLHLYAETAVQYIKASELEKMIAEKYGEEVLQEIINFVESNVKVEDLDSFIEKESLEQYFLNLDKLVNHIKEDEKGDA